MKTFTVSVRLAPATFTVQAVSKGRAIGDAECMLAERLGIARHDLDFAEVVATEITSCDHRWSDSAFGNQLTCDECGSEKDLGAPISE